MRERLLRALDEPRDARELARMLRVPLWRVVDMLVALEREGFVQRVPMGWGAWVWRKRK